MPQGYNAGMPTKQPNSHMCFICGMENPVGLHLHIYETEAGVVETTYYAPDHFQGYPGVLHGGIVGAIIDEIAGRTHMGSDPMNPRFMFTAKLEVKYRKNVPAGEPLRLVGRAVKDNGRIATARGELFGPGGDLLAEADAVLVDVPTDNFAGVDLQALGWQVYPDE